MISNEEKPGDSEESEDLQRIDALATERGLETVLQDEIVLKRTQHTCNRLCRNKIAGPCIVGGEALACCLWTSGCCDIRMVSRSDGGGENRLFMKKEPSIVLHNVALPGGLIKLAYSLSSSTTSLLDDPVVQSKARQAAILRMMRSCHGDAENNASFTPSSPAGAEGIKALLPPLSVKTITAWVHSCITHDWDEGTP
jgi:hypothetical protein